jgi:plasmid maintenance system killer protein
MEPRRAARRRLLYIREAADLGDLRSPPGNRPERLKGDLIGFDSIRINERWRVVFRWSGGSVFGEQIFDIAIAEAQAIEQPHGMANNFSGQPAAVLERIFRAHPVCLADRHLV